MKASFENIDKVFDFKGIWDIPSKCGLKIIQKEDKFIILVSELYQDNPGTSITQATTILAKQICDEYSLPKNKIIYIEHNPDMKSKLSFYDEEFYRVEFEKDKDDFENPKWTQLTAKQLKEFLEK